VRVLVRKFELKTTR